MKRSRFTNEQFIGILKEHRRAAGLGALPQAQRQRCQHLQGKAKFGGMDVSETKRMKTLGASRE